MKSRTMSGDCPECGWFKFDGELWGVIMHDNASLTACEHMQGRIWCGTCARTWYQAGSIEPSIGECPGCEDVRYRQGREMAARLKAALGPWSAASWARS